MKKIILFLLFLTAQTVLFAQEHEYIPFVEEGKVWYCGYSHPDVILPSTLSGDYQIELIMDDWLFVGWINM